MASPLPLSELRELCESTHVPMHYRRIELKNQLQRNIEAMRSLSESRDPSKPFQADEKRRFDTYDTACSIINLALQTPDADEVRLEQEVKFRRENPRLFGSSMGVYEREDSEQALVRSFIDGSGPRTIRIPVRQAMRERELVRGGMDPDEARTLVWDTGSIASGVPTLMARSLYEVLEAQVAMLRMPTTKIPTESGANMDFPRLTTHIIGTQVAGQGTVIGGTDPVLAKTTFGAFKYGALIQVAHEVVEDTGFDILGLVARDSGRAVGRLVDADLVVGSGSGEPNGVMTAIVGAGTVSTGGSLITPTYEHLVNLKYSVIDEYRNGGNAAWLMRDSTAGTLLKLRDGAGGTIGAPLWQTAVTGGVSGYRQPDMLLGDPAFTDVNIASMASNNKIIAYGDFSAYYIRHVGDIVLERDDSFAFDSDLITFRAKWRVDGDLLDTAAINILKQSV